MQIRILALLCLISMPALGGCNRQDTDAISRIGAKVMAHTRSHLDDVQPKFDVPWPDAKKPAPTLQEKIQDRLRYENTLTEVTFEVLVKDKEVELRGSVNDALQRQRAVELAETVAGVEKVVNSIQLTDAEQ